MSGLPLPVRGSDTERGCGIAPSQYATHEGRVCPGSHGGLRGSHFPSTLSDPLLLCVATRDAAIDVQWRPYTIPGETALGTRSIGGATGGNRRTGEQDLLNNSIVTLRKPCIVEQSLPAAKELCAIDCLLDIPPSPNLADG